MHFTNPNLAVDLSFSQNLKASIAAELKSTRLFDKLRLFTSGDFPDKTACEKPF